MATVFPRGHSGDTSGFGGGGGPPDGNRSRQPPNQCETDDYTDSDSDSDVDVLKLQGQRGKTTMVKFRKKNPVGDGLKPIRFEAGARLTYKPVGDYAQNFASVVGTIVDRFPQRYKSWKKVPNELKNLIWTELSSYFDMEPHVHLRDGIERYAGNRYKDHKFRFKEKHFTKKGGEDRVDIKEAVPPDMIESEWEEYVKYYTSDEVKARSAVNKTNKSKAKIRGHNGRTSLAQCRDKFRVQGAADNETGSPIQGYRDYYTDENGNFYQPEVADFHAQMLQMQREHPDMSENAIMRSVLGESDGWERGIGPIPPAYVRRYQPPPAPQMETQRMFSQAEVEGMISARLASEQQNWMASMMAQMQSQMQSQIQSQVDQALQRGGTSQQQTNQNPDEGGPSNS